MTSDIDHDPSARPARSGSASLTAYQRGIALLARREHSRSELQQKLLQRGHEPQEVAAALDRLSEQGLQSETRFAESITRMRVGAGHGPLRIRNDLRQKGINVEGIDSAIEDAAPDWLQSAVDALSRRFGEAGTEPGDGSNEWPARDRQQQDEDRRLAMKLRSRQLAFLLRRGFDAETARSAQSRWERGG